MQVKKYGKAKMGRKSKRTFSSHNKNTPLQHAVNFKNHQIPQLPANTTIRLQISADADDTRQPKQDVFVINCRFNISGM